jgi:hypothetical protein
MTWLIRGKITAEKQNPINRFLIWAYQPFVNFVLRFRWLTLCLALLLLGLTYIPFSQLGKEFMPPLNEGTLLYMPTAVPGISITEATKVLQIQDRILRKFPEVESVFGKAGEADTPTDPAPLSMFETVLQLKPPDQWRPGMTGEKLVAQMNEATKTPGMAQIFWMPIQTRTEMLTTGFRSILGIKVFGRDLKGIQDVAIAIEKALSVCAILFGLLPIMWSPVYQAGADVMKRIATPMIGGVVTSAILELLIYPVIYVIWRRRDLPINGRVDNRPPANIRPKSGATFIALRRFLTVALIAAALFVGGFEAWNWWNSRSSSAAQIQGEPIATRTIGELTISLYGDLHNGQSEVLVRFTDASGQPKDVGELKTDLNMNMPGMVMNSGGDVTKTSTPGVYHAKLQPQMGGDWVVKLSWQGPAGEGQVEIPVSVKQ